MYNQVMENNIDLAEAFSSALVTDFFSCSCDITTALVTVGEEVMPGSTWITSSPNNVCFTSEINKWAWMWKNINQRNNRKYTNIVDLSTYSHIPVLRSHWSWLSTTPSGSQLQSSHPMMGSNPYVYGVHWSHFSPLTLAGQIQSPVEYHFIIIIKDV